MCLATSGHWTARAAKKSFENAHLYRRFTEGNSMETAAGRPGAARHLKTRIFTEGLQKEIAWKRPPGSQTAAGKPGTARHLKTSIFTEG